MLDDDSLSDDLGCVITDVGLVQRVFNIDAGRGEVSEIHDCHEVEVAIEMAGVVSRGESEQLRDLAQGVKRIAIPLFRLWGDSLSPSDRDDLTEHGTPFRRRPV